MKSKKMGFYLVMVAVLFVFAITPVMPAEKPMTIKLAHVLPPGVFDSPMNAACISFKNAVENLTSGRIKVDIYPGGTLGTELDLMEAVKTNQIQLHLATPGGLFRVFPPAFLYNTPYMFRNELVGMRVVDGPFSEKLLEGFTAETGIVALGFIHVPSSAVFTNNVRPIKTPADMKGIKFRAMDNLQIAMFQALGASGVPIPWPELYTSLQTGVVQGQVNPAFLVKRAKFFEVQKYLTTPLVMQGGLLFVCSKKWYEALSPEDQKIMKHATKYGKVVCRGLGMLLEGIALEDLKKEGIKITVLSESAVQGFANIALPKCLEWLKTQMDPKWVDGLVKATKEGEAKLGY